MSKPLFEGFMVEPDEYASSENFSDDEDLLPFEYARAKGLSTDYTLQAIGDALHLPSPPDELVTCFESLPTDPPLQEANTHEKLTVDIATRAFLADILKQPEASEPLDEPQTRRSTSSSLKLEIPILHSDHELDVRQFGKTHLPDFKNLTATLPVEPVDVEKDEGLAWPPSIIKAAGQVNQKLTSEKMEVTKETIMFIQQCLQSEHVHDEIFHSYKKTAIVEPVTPPLLPLSPPLSPLMPPVFVERIEPATSTAGSINTEMKAVDERIFAQDAIQAPTRPEAEMSDPMLSEGAALNAIFSPLGNIALEPSSSPFKRKPQLDLKVSPPLTPIDSTPSPLKKIKSKTVSFPESLHEYIPELPSTYDNGDDVLGSQKSFDAFFKDSIGPIADKANRAVEQEQLDEADTTKRVEIPVMDWSQPLPPWKITEQPLLQKVLNEAPKSVKQWAGSSKVERLLPWSPFHSKLGQVALDEEIDDEKALAEMMRETEPFLVESSHLTWKPPGLRVLDESDDSYDELETHQFPILDDMESLVRKRKLEMDPSRDGVPIAAKQPRMSSMTTTSFQTKKSYIDQDPNLMQKHARNPTVTHESQQPVISKLDTDSSMMFGGPFSASSALSNFMHLQGSSAKLPFESARIVSQVQKDTSQVSHPSGESTRSIPQERQAAKSDVAIALPALPNPLPTTPLIIATSVLRDCRPLVRSLQHLVPGLTLIERDFSSQSSLINDADILVSPSTSLLLTTIQKIKQRPLPGQAESPTSIRARIAAVSVCTEHLIVLVSASTLQPPKPSSLITSWLNTPNAATSDAANPPLDVSDTMALATLTASCTQLDTDVNIVFVPGGLTHMVHSILLVHARYGNTCTPSSTSTAPTSLLPDETLWELFLRHAGLNAYAAQVVLSALKVSPPVQAGSNPDSSDQSSLTALNGLPAFVVMPQAERERRFASLLGGTRVLRHVGRVLDGGWVSARNGFRMKGVD